jgi:hypothetical protein
MPQPRKMDMKTPFTHPHCLRHLTWLCALSIVMPAYALELRIVPPPPPEKVVREARGFFHRLFNNDRNRTRSTDQPRVTSRSKSSTIPAPGPGTIVYSEDGRLYRQEVSVSPEPRMRPGTELPPRIRPVEPQMKVTTPKSSTSAARKPSATPKPEATAVPPPAPITPLPETSAQSASINSSAPPAPPADESIQYARPVPGKRGLVYAPGGEESSATMVDVSEFKPGQLARDPRTGKIFRVP